MELFATSIPILERISSICISSRFNRVIWVSTLPCKNSLTAVASKSILRSTSESNAELTESKSRSIFALISTASLLFPFSRLSLGFHNSGVHDSLQLNCAIVLFTVIRPIIGAFPNLSRPLFFR